MEKNCQGSRISVRLNLFLNLGISVYVAVSRVIPYSEPVCITSKTGCPMCIVELTSRTSPILL